MASKPTYDFNKKFEDNEMVETKVDPREAMLKQLKAKSVEKEYSYENSPSDETSTSSRSVKEPKESKPAKTLKQQTEAFFEGGKEGAEYRITIRMPDDLAKFVDKMHKDKHLSKNDVILTCIRLVKKQLE